MDRGRISPASEAVLPLSLEQQQDHFDSNEDRYLVSSSLYIT